MEPTKAVDIRNSYNTFLENLTKQIDERLVYLEEKEKEWEKLEAQMEKNAAIAKNKIRLEVGGTIFTTSKSVLLRLENTYFHAMLASGKWQPDEDGVYFIDRDPTHFGRIVEYMRTGELSFDGLDDESIKKLESDLDYFQIPLLDQVKHSLAHPVCSVL
jgi:hypothetical protein